jgi:DNA-binding LytR/AlgR family response regulator
MIRTIIIEDEAPARALLRSYLEKLPNWTLLAEFDNALDAIAYLSTATVDVIFLDIQLPRLSGISFIRTLDHPPLIVITTAYSEHAVEAFELTVFDYLLKPFPLERFLKTVNRIQTHLQQPPKPEDHTQTQPPLHNHPSIHTQPPIQNQPPNHHPPIQNQPPNHHPSIQNQPPNHHPPIQNQPPDHHPSIHTQPPIHGGSSQSPFNPTQQEGPASQNPPQFPFPPGTPSQPPLEPAHLLVRANRHHTKVPIAEILYIESQKEYLRIVCTHREVRTRMSITKIQAQLARHDFLRVHRSFLVPLAKVESFSGTEVRIAHHRIPIGRLYQREVRTRLS